MKYFTNVSTIEELKQQYKKLAKELHPDHGGTTEQMQELNKEYTDLFNKYKDIHKDKEGKTYTAREHTQEQPQDFINVINALITLDGITLDICGSWLWITGETLKYKDLLKKLKCKYSSNKKAWYYTSEPYHKKNKHMYTLNEIKTMFGDETLSQKETIKINQ